MPDAEIIISRLYRIQQTEDINYADFYEALFQYYLNPIDLNNSDPEELRSLYILTDNQISAIINHIRVYGDFKSVYELQSLPDLPVETIANLLPFITIKLSDETWQGLYRQLQKPDQHYLLLRSASDLEKAKGYKSISEQPPAYQGNSQNMYFRYRLQRYKSYSFGMTLEKDPGEKIMFNRQSKTLGADFYSFHAIIYNRGRIKKIALGDYQVQFGQGLVLSGGFFTGKGSETILSVRRSSTGIRPYTSLLESGFLRGTAATLAFGNFELTPFISVKFNDGTLSSDTIQDKSLAVLQYTGFHRTSSELLSKSSVSEQIAGLNGQFTSVKKNFLLGLNLLKIKYDKDLKTTSRYYNYYAFKGNENQNGSLYYSFLFKNISLFGERALSKGDGKGFIQGAMLSLGLKTDLSLVYRNYSKELNTPYGNSFGENYKNNNEKGFYWGLKIRPDYKLEFTFYYDTYLHPWLKYRVSSPSVGQEYQLSTRYKFNRKTILFVQFRDEKKEKDTEIFSADRQLFFHYRKNGLVTLDLHADKEIQLRSKLQLSSYKVLHKTTTGYYIAQDLSYEKQKFAVTVRCALFDTDDFENRQYAYENDVLYSFSIPFFSGRGMRNYVVARINLTRNLGLWLKYSRTTYFDRQLTGSGNEQIEGNTRSEIRSEIRYMLH